MTTTSILEPYEPGPLFRMVLIGGPSGHWLRDAFDRRLPYIGRAAGRWIQVHTLGDPRGRDHFADEDRRVRGVEPTDLYREWQEAITDLGSEQVATAMREEEAARRWKVNQDELPCIFVFYPGEVIPRTSSSLGEHWWKGIEDEVARAAERAFAESNLLTYIRAQGWVTVGPEELDEILAWIFANFADAVIATLGETKGEPHLYPMDLRILAHLSKCDSPQTTREIAKALGSSMGSIGKNLSRLVVLRLIRKNGGYEINSLGRLKSLRT